MDQKQDSPLIAITMGDPCGIGAEIIVNAFDKRAFGGDCRVFVVGDANAMQRAVALSGTACRIRMITSPAQAHQAAIDEIPLLALTSLGDADIHYANPTPASGDAAYSYICAAARFCLDGQVAAMATAPINKKAMNMAGHDFPGHTELLAKLSNTDSYVMMLAGDVLRVSLVTIHEALGAVPGLVTREKVLATIRVTHQGLQRLTGKQRPSLAVLSLNPHGGEGGMFGNEEQVSIIPAIQDAVAEGIDATGPYSADTLFHFAKDGIYDGVVAMYHDQGLIPLKMRHFSDAVNVTLGLPIIRTSVDHGTAYDLAGSGRASSDSLVAAVRMAMDMARNV